MPRSHGFTLIEMLIATAVLSIFIAAVFLILQTSSQSLGEARVRSMAIQLAQDQLELSRNLNYDRIGTVAGIPPGDLIQNQQIDKLGTRFSVQTSVLYIDDPFDGLAPTDLLPTDYKRVRISVSWSGVFKSKAPVVLMTDISPQGLESADNSGTVVAMVFDALGEPVTNALVKIQATSLSPPVQMKLTPISMAK